MSKAKIVTDNDGRFYGIRFDCPGCALAKQHGTKMVVLPVDWTPPGYARSPNILRRSIRTANGSSGNIPALASLMASKAESTSMPSAAAKKNGTAG